MQLEGSRLQVVISGVSSRCSPCLSGPVGISLRAIAHRSSSSEETYAANLEAEWGLSPEEVQRASRENMLLAFGAGGGQDRRRSIRRPAALGKDSILGKAAMAAKLVKCPALLFQRPLVGWPYL